ncbi:MAG: STAS domain-containing protein [Anaerolineae bacterium]|nr:STAS domain-containing protein [Anaerolineae bacterium]
MGLEMTEVLQSGEYAVLTLAGRLDAETAPDLKVQLKGLVGAGQVLLVLELTNLSFIDSAGLAALVSVLKTAREAGGTLRLVGLNERTATAFKLTLLDRVFEFYPDVGAALAHAVGERPVG